MSISRRDVITGAVGATVGAGVLSLIGLTNRAMSVDEAASKMSLRMEGDFRVLESNGLPGHAIGDFPNRHDPVAVRPQSHQLRMPAKPIQNEKPIPINMWWFGVAVNGVPFDPSGPFWNSDVSAGWQFEVLHPANSIALGIDRNNAHTQGGGMYHYHGMPAGLLASLMSLDPSRRMMLVGYAADGFPIYGPESPESPGDLQSPIRRLRPSYRLSDVKRTSGPLGKPDGRFCEDHIYEPGFGDLDESNGRFGCTPEFPDGTYYYVITDSFPFIPRLYRGQPDASFTHGPPPGVSPPIPQELRAYRSA